MILVRKNYQNTLIFMIFAGKIYKKSRILHDFCPKNAKIFHSNCTKNIFLNFRGPPAPPFFYAYDFTKFELFEHFNSKLTVHISSLVMATAIVSTHYAFPWRGGLWLNVKTVCPQTVTHPSTNLGQR